METKNDLTEHREDGRKLSDSATDDHALNEDHQPRYNDQEVRRIRRKVDYRVLPLLTFLYLASFVDRGNVGNAAVAGMVEDLELSGSQYNLVLTVSSDPMV